jgi:hypothetical protein
MFKSINTGTLVNMGLNCMRVLQRISSKLRGNKIADQAVFKKNINTAPGHPFASILWRSVRGSPQIIAQSTERKVQAKTRPSDNMILKAAQNHA